MKKVLLSAVALVAFTFANAQETDGGYKPKKGTITTEVGLTGGLNNADFALNTGVLKFRYFLKDDLGLRLGLGINSNKTETVDNVTDPTNVMTTIDRHSTTTLNLGIEKHFAGAERLSTYAGADLLLNFRGASTEYTENGFSAEADGAIVDVNTGTINGAYRAGTDFGFRVFTGADYYITKKVYLGVEAGINLMTGKDKDVEFSATGTPNFTVLGGKTNGINTSVVGGVRIGYQF